MRKLVSLTSTSGASGGQRRDRGGHHRLRRPGRLGPKGDPEPAGRRGGGGVRCLPAESGPGAEPGRRELDYDSWVGPAPQRPFGQVWGRGRRLYWDFYGGMLTEWGSHLADIVLWAMGVRGPRSVAAAGGLFQRKECEIPDTLQVTYEYDEHHRVSARAGRQLDPAPDAYPELPRLCQEQETAQRGHRRRARDQHGVPVGQHRLPRGPQAPLGRGAGARDRRRAGAAAGGRRLPRAVDTEGAVRKTAGAAYFGDVSISR